MTYDEFISTGKYDTVYGQHDPTHRYPFPLWFDHPDLLLDAMTYYSWLDDYRYGDHESSAILSDVNSALKPVALMDLGYEGCEEVEIDSYCEEIFLVDTKTPGNPVYLWGHDGGPSKIHDRFDTFLDSLEPFEFDDES